MTAYYKRSHSIPRASRPNIFGPSDYDDYGSFSWTITLRAEDFIKLMKATLRSKKVTSLIHSLIARSNQRRHFAGHPTADHASKKAAQQA